MVAPGYQQQMLQYLFVVFVCSVAASRLSSLDPYDDDPNTKFYIDLSCNYLSYHHSINYETSTLQQKLIYAHYLACVNVIWPGSTHRFISTAEEYHIQPYDSFESGQKLITLEQQPCLIAPEDGCFIPRPINGSLLIYYHKDKPPMNLDALEKLSWPEDEEVMKFRDMFFGGYSMINQKQTSNTPNVTVLLDSNGRKGISFINLVNWLQISFNVKEYDSTRLNSFRTFLKSEYPTLNLCKVYRTESEDRVLPLKPCFTLIPPENGYLDGMVRGYRTELITSVQYSAFIQCDTLEDLRTQLLATPAFGEQELVAGEVVTPTSITKRLYDRFAEQFRYLHSNSSGQMKRFIEFITYLYQIDNVVLLISGTLHGYEKEELLERCHPLGMFEALPAITVASTSNEIYHTVLAESALGPYFKHCLSADDLDEMHVEIIRGTLTRTYLEHFMTWIKTECDDRTSETMNDLLSFEADRRILNIVLSTMGNGLSAETKLGLFPRFGRLWETGVAAELAAAEDMTTFRNALYPCSEYRLLFPEEEDSKSPTGIADPSAYSERSLEEQLAEREVAMCKLAFAYHFTFTPLYAWTKLKEQELRNVKWIAECIAQRQKQHIAHYIATN